MNVDDNLSEARRPQCPNLAEDHSLYDRRIEIAQSGEGSMDGFVNGLKGKAADLNAAETLKRSGFADVTIAPNPNQPAWDVSAASPSGEEVFFQAKTGVAERAGEIESLAVVYIVRDFKPAPRFQRDAEQTGARERVKRDDFSEVIARHVDLARRSF